MPELDPVPDPEAAALMAATEALERANDEWTLAVIEALNTGASTQVIATLAGVTEDAIAAIASRRPSPPDRQ